MAEVTRVWLLRPELLSALTRHMAMFERETGKRTTVRARGGVRSSAVQSAIHADSLAQGFRAAPAGKSMHEYGAAYDLVILGTGKDAAVDQANPLYERLAVIGESLGLRAGQHFKTGDKPDPYHFELRESLATARVRWAALTRARLRRAALVVAAAAVVVVAARAFILNRSGHAVSA